MAVELLFVLQELLLPELGCLPVGILQCGDKIVAASFEVQAHATNVKVVATPFTKGKTGRITVL